MLACGRIDYDGVHAQVLVVDVIDDRFAGPADMRSPRDLDPGATGLSLREAITIANNAPGADLIAFDPSLFPSSSTTPITPSEPLPPISGEGTEIHAEGVTLDASATGGAAVVIAASGVVLRGLTIVGAPDVAIHIEPGLEGVGVSETTILDSGGRAIEASACRGLTIDHTRIERPGSDLVYVEDCVDVSITDNFMVIGDKDANRGVHFTRVNDSRVADNIIDPGSARLVDLLDSSNNEIVHNILDRGHAGVVLEGESHANLVFQNVIIGSVYDGVYVSGESTGNTVVHNTMFQCSSNLVDGASDTVSGNNFFTDDETQFVDPASYDFTLVPGSESIDAGDDLGFDCRPGSPELFLGAGPDLGAVESG